MTFWVGQLHEFHGPALWQSDVMHGDLDYCLVGASFSLLSNQWIILFNTSIWWS